MSRKTELKNLDHTNMMFLFPHEIISRLDRLVATLPVDLAHPVEIPAEGEREQEVLETVLDHIESREGKEHRTDTVVPLTENQEGHLAYWILFARREAYKLLESQADTPLGFERIPRAVVSNILLARWIDLTKGGTVVVEWEKID